MKDKIAEKGLLNDIIMFIPNLVTLLYRLMADARVQFQEKAIFLATIAYVVSPIDFMPDFIPFLGQVDDILLISLIMLRFMETAGHDMVEEYWDGSAGLLDMFKKTLGLSGLFLPKSVYDKVVKKSGYRDDAIDVEFKVHKD